MESYTYLNMPDNVDDWDAEDWGRFIDSYGEVNH